VAGTASVTVNKATPTVTAWPTAGVIQYGQTLAASNLTGGTASVAGSFAFTAPTTAPAVGANAQSVTFTPTDTVDYTAVTGTASVTVISLEFTMTSSGPLAQTVVPGSAVTYQFTMAPTYGSYASPVYLSASGLPPGATVTFSPATVAANSKPQTVTLTIQTAAETAQNNGMPSKLAPLALALFLFPLLGSKKMRQEGRAMSRWLSALALIAGMAAFTALGGCGGHFFSQPAKDYTVTVTATSGSLQHTLTFTLNVQ